MSSTKEFVASAIILALAAIGLILQVYYVSDRYFEYKTATVISVSNPNPINDIPSLSTCWDLGDIINRTAIKDDLNIDLIGFQRSNYANRSKYYELIKKLTVHDYFRYTPSNESIFAKDRGCFVRFSKQWIIEFPTNCYKHFRIHIYIHRDMMCYKLHLIADNRTVYMDEYSLVPEESGMIYKIFLDKNIFGRINFYSTFVHGNGTARIFDSGFTPKRYYHTNTSFYLNVDVTYGSISTISLPEPYDTHCRDIPGFDSMVEHWLHMFRILVIENLHLIDSFTPIKEDIEYNEHTKHNEYNLTLLGVEQLMNDSIRKRVNELFSEVPDEPIVCNSLYYVSKHTIGYSDQVVIGVYYPQEYFINISHVESQGLLDYVVYLCSSIGIWFGLSFCSLITPINKCLIRINKKKIKIKPGKCIENSVKIQAMFQYFKIVTNDLRQTIHGLERELILVRSAQVRINLNR